MDAVTQQNAALVEEVAAAAESMEEESERLTHAVSVFKLAVPAARLSKSSGNKEAMAVKNNQLALDRKKRVGKPVMLSQKDNSDEWKEF